MIYKWLVICPLLIASYASNAQDTIVSPGKVTDNLHLTPEQIEKIKNGHLIQGQIIDGDTVLHVYLESLVVLPPIEFTTKKEQFKYTRLVYNVKKVYPYSLLIKNKLNEVNKELQGIENKVERKKFVKEKEKELREQFEGELVKLTVTQGRILMRLVDRETGYTTYELLDEIKGSFSAVLWQSVARVFGSNLKTGFDPTQGEDALIEDIIIRIENGQL